MNNSYQYELSNIETEQEADRLDADDKVMLNFVI